MKKLFKYEWKYYLFFLFAMLIALFVLEAPHKIELSWISAEDERILYFNITEVLWRIEGLISGSLLNYVVCDVLMGILLMKAIFFWLEKESYGREFLSTLPITRMDRKKFHLIMDSLLIVISVVVFTLYLYYEISEQLQMKGLNVPWMASTVFGEMLICMAYLLFLLGIVNVLECLFVDGFIRIVGTAGSIFMCLGILEMSFRLKETSTWMQNIYGFFMLEKVGGCYYQLKLADQMLYWNKSGYWTHQAIDYVVYYKGKLVTRPGDIDIGEDLGRFVDFSNVNSYIGYLFAYLALALVLMGVAMYLAGKQELSKQGFYFDFGRFLFCGLLCVCFMETMMLNALAKWHYYLIVAATVVIFVILTYLMKPDRKRYLKKKVAET